jgi:hypothetical protein
MEPAYRLRARARASSRVKPARVITRRAGARHHASSRAGYVSTCAEEASMSSRRSHTRWALWAAVALSLLASACAASAPFVVALPNGYYLQRDRAANVALVKRGGRTLIPGPIAAYSVAGNVVAGCVGEWPRRSSGYPNETPFPDSADCRYFILDTASGRIEQNLTPEAWRSRLKEYGAPQALRITAPVLPL